jgi:drug/metabolite transporter (DMT)-like permease
MSGGKAAHDHDQVLSGILCRVGSGLCFSTMAALLKLASTQGMNAPELVFYRNLFSLPVVLLWVLRRDTLAALKPNRPSAHLWRSGLGIISMGLGFQALILLPLATATAINFTAPIFATILSFLLLKEQVGLHRWAAVLAGFAGVLVITRPGGSGLPALGVMIALVAATSQAGVTTTLRQIHRTEKLAAIVFWFAMTGIVAGGVLMPFFGRAHGTEAFSLVVAGGLIGGLGQLLVTASLRAPVSVISPFDYLQIVAATIYGWLLFSDVPRISTIAGAGLIAGSGIYTAWREHRRRLREAIAAVPAV